MATAAQPIPDILELIANETDRKKAQRADAAMHRVFPPKVSASYSRFRAVVWETILRSAALKDCSMDSKLVAAHICAKLGLVPDPTLGQVYILPRKNRGNWEACVQVGYKGIIALAYRSRVVKSIRAYPIFENDLFEYEEGINPILRHKPYDLIGKTEPASPESMKLWTKGVVGAFAIAEIDGGSVFRVVTLREINRAMQSSPSASSGYSPWKTDFAEMAAKTAVHRLGKILPLSAEDPELSIALDVMDRTDAGQHYEVPEELLEAGVAASQDEDRDEQGKTVHAVSQSVFKRRIKEAGFSEQEAIEAALDICGKKPSMLSEDEAERVIQSLIKERERNELDADEATLAAPSGTLFGE